MLKVIWLNRLPVSLLMLAESIATDLIRRVFEAAPIPTSLGGSNSHMVEEMNLL